MSNVNFGTMSIHKKNCFRRVCRFMAKNYLLILYPFLGNLTTQIITLCTDRDGVTINFNAAVAYVTFRYNMG